MNLYIFLNARNDKKHNINFKSKKNYYDQEYFYITSVYESNRRFESSNLNQQKYTVHINFQYDILTDLIEVSSSPCVPAQDISHSLVLEIDGIFTVKKNMKNMFNIQMKHVI